MEGEGGRFRRRHLVPIPVVASIGELDQHLEAADVADDARRIGHRTSTVGEDFAAERPQLLALPAEPFDAARLLPARRVDHKDHYLEVLVRKPGALPGATALAQAREQGAFTPTHQAFWTAARLS